MNSIKLTGNNEVEARRQTQRADAVRETDERDIAQTDKNSGLQSADVINVSERAAGIRALIAQAKEVPEVRTEQVERLRSLIQTGQYQPSAEDIADALLKNSEN